jgi:hypothetical protein
MKPVIALLLALVCIAPAAATGRQRIVVQRQRVVVQRVVVPHRQQIVVQRFVQPHHHVQQFRVQQFVQPVYGVQQFNAGCNSLQFNGGGCQQFFR